MRAIDDPLSTHAPAPRPAPGAPRPAPPSETTATNHDPAEVKANAGT